MHTSDVSVIRKTKSPNTHKMGATHSDNIHNALTSYDFLLSSRLWIKAFFLRKFQ